MTTYSQPSAAVSNSRQRLSDKEVLNGFNSFAAFQKGISREARKLGGHHFLVRDEIAAIAEMVAADPPTMTERDARKESQIFDTVAWLILENIDHHESVLNGEANPFVMMASLETEVVNVASSSTRRFGFRG